MAVWMREYLKAIRERVRRSSPFFRPFRGWRLGPFLSHGSRRGLHSFAASRLVSSGYKRYYAYSIVTVIFAVFSSIADTEQYFSFESLTASSIDFFETLPFTTYLSLISV